MGDWHRARALAEKVISTLPYSELDSLESREEAMERLGILLCAFVMEQFFARKGGLSESQRVPQMESSHLKKLTRMIDSQPPGVGRDVFGTYLNGNSRRRSRLLPGACRKAF